jgi:hypothetical protein
MWYTRRDALSDAGEERDGDLDLHVTPAVETGIAAT